MWDFEDVHVSSTEYIDFVAIQIKKCDCNLTGEVTVCVSAIIHVLKFKFK